MQYGILHSCEECFHSSFGFVKIHHRTRAIFSRIARKLVYVSLKNACVCLYNYQSFNRSERCSIVALFQLCSTYTIFEYLVHISFHMDKLHKHYNFMEIQWKWLRIHKQSIPGRFPPPSRPGYKASCLHENIYGDYARWFLRQEVILYKQNMLQLCAKLPMPKTIINSVLCGYIPVIKVPRIRARMESPTANTM